MAHAFGRLETANLTVTTFSGRRRKTFLIWYLKSQKVVPQSPSECDGYNRHLEPSPTTRYPAYSSH